MHVDPTSARYRLGTRKGHYESWFIRGNHPTRPLAFWIRYTVTSPKGRPGDAVAELFAAYFDGETRRHVATRQAHPLRDAMFPTEALDVRIGPAHLTTDRLVGRAERAGVAIGWDVSVHGGGDPLYLLPERLYAGGFPKAKALVMRPGTTFAGHVEITRGPGDSERVDVGGWVGSTNHNWGSKHTDHYVWGQVAGFDEAPDSFLEVATARIRIAGMMTPAMTPLVLRHRGREHRLNALHTVFGRATIDRLDWRFRAKGPGVALAGRIHMRPEDFVVFAYTDPPGGTKPCINSKIAACELTLTVDGRREELGSASRAAMEILVDDPAAQGITGLPAPI
ncbi:MAG: hypothetical protein IT385_23130 [Deltaproteobacteria bacterium]|nr:hypothetical protein [Deltaproteobacteria bacterium]